MSTITEQQRKKAIAFYIIPPFFIFMMTFVFTFLINKISPKNDNEEVEFDTTIVGSQDSTIVTNRILAYERELNDSNNTYQEVTKLNQDEDNLDRLIEENTKKSLSDLNQPAPAPRQTYGGGGRQRSNGNYRTNDMVDNYFQQNVYKETPKPIAQAEPVVTTSKNNIKIALAVVGGGTFKNNQSIRLRVIKEVIKDEITIPKGTIVTGKVTFDNSKVYITISGSSLDPSFKHPFRLYENDEVGMIYNTPEGNDNVNTAKNEAIRDVVNEASSYIPGVPIVRTLTGSVRALIRPNGKIESIEIQDNQKLKFE